MNTPDRPPELSVIIPALDEQATLPGLLADLRRQEGIRLEVLVADGGSTDGTRAVCESFGARWLAVPRGRGAQMNAAEAEAAGEFVFFLHADSRLDDPRLLATALAALRRAEAGSPHPLAGHFPLRFDRTTPGNGLFFRYIEAKTETNRPQTINGDQGMLLSRAFFRQLGGFDQSLPILEDQRLAARVRATGGWIILPGRIRTSARRFESEGVHRRYLLMGMMMGMYALKEWSFFERAPEVYRLQADTGRLLLGPVFGLLWEMIRRDWGLIGTLGRMFRLGGYLRENAWQPCLFVDLLLARRTGEGRRSFSTFHDRWLARWLDFRLIDGLLGLLGFVWYMVLVAGCFRLREGWDAIFLLRGDDGRRG